VNNELERIWKETVELELDITSRNSFRADEKYEKFQSSTLQVPSKRRRFSATVYSVWLHKTTFLVRKAGVNYENRTPDPRICNCLSSESDGRNFVLAASKLPVLPPDSQGNTCGVTGF